VPVGPIGYQETTTNAIYAEAREEAGLPADVRPVGEAHS
jgi:hypothetical protein